MPSQFFGLNIAYTGLLANNAALNTTSNNIANVQTEGFSGDAYLLLRTHGEQIADMTGGSFKKVEKDAYLLKLTADTAEITLKPETESYYK